MLVIDSSAILAMMFGEPEAAACARALGAGSPRLVSAVSYVEAGTALASRAKPRAVHRAATDLDAFLAGFAVEIAPVTEELARAALKARIRHGKGLGRRKGLNFGDSFAYALARSLSAPLLFVGDDFTGTDLKPALT